MHLCAVIDMLNLKHGQQCGPQEISDLLAACFANKMARYLRYEPHAYTAAHSNTNV
jgi:hypothetical protein